MTEAWDFCGMEAFWERYSPLTPWGKDAKDARAVFADRPAIEARHDDIERAAAWISGREVDPVALDRMSYHLKRMPRVPFEAKDEYELIELFQVKKFLANHRGVLAALGEEAAAAFGLSPACQELAGELDRGGSDAETFYLADCYDAELAAVRSDLSRCGERERAEKARAEAAARVEWGLDFDGREFLLAAKELVAGAPAERFAIEPYDDGRYLVRLRPSAAALALAEEREALLLREREAENRVVSRLSAMVASAMPELAKAVGAIARWDAARAGAALAAEFCMVRPDLGSDSLELEGARFVPCQLECERLGLSYSPLSARFDADAVVVFGSNMGGKTVVLKTILFFQLLAQAGLFVPARGFRTRVYGRVEYVGELTGERLAGLSGFGFEVWRLQRAWSEAGDALVAFDELARTTGSHEAEALLSAVVEAYAGSKGGGAGGARTRAFFATHFRGVARVPGAEYRRMLGLDREAAGAAMGGGEALAERLAGINRHMRYELVPDDGSGSDQSDALAVAAMLGLDRALVRRAAEFFGERPGKA